MVVTLQPFFNTFYLFSIVNISKKHKKYDLICFLLSFLVTLNKLFALGKAKINVIFTLRFALAYILMAGWYVYVQPCNTKRKECRITVKLCLHSAY